MKKNVNLFSDPSVGKKVGYHDGWLAEEDDLGPIFEYTGAGLQGDQTFEGTGNRAILQHVQQGRTLRVFELDGQPPKRGPKPHKYLGPFTLDAERPYEWREVPDAAGTRRQVIIFRLRPDGEVVRQAEAQVPVAERTTATLVPMQGMVTTEMFESEPATSGALGRPKRRASKKRTGRAVDPHPETSGTFVVSEAFVTKMSHRAATAANVVVRREAELTQAFREHLEAAGRRTGAFQIKVAGQTSTLRTDLYDATAHVLYEAKGSTSREDIRMGLGQLLDYGRHVSTPEHPEEPQLAILLPADPHQDLSELLNRYGVRVVHQLPDGGFTGDGVPDAPWHRP
ncbi:hypothetical protein ACFYNO_09480 [Kitasatospora sp. NPDC006697]|uniref:hypothetical protein n=1 Tax=Kitasatospora sp. NPDC006697 TaxID=3364020 RepID=UPI003692B27A